MGKVINMNVTLNMLDRLEHMYEDLTLDAWGQNYFDNYEMQQRNIGRIRMMRDSHSTLAPEVLRQWFDIATEDYETIASNLDHEPFVDFHTITLEDHNLTEMDSNS